MKHTKRFASLLLVLLMALSLMAVPAMAAQEGELTGGSITISNAYKGETYRAYQILYLESYDPDTDAYAYKANSAWKNWLKTQTQYVSIDDQGYVTWVKDAKEGEFAKAALKYAQENFETADATEAAAERTDGEEVNATTTVTISNLKLGYYLVDSSLGTVCSLTTTKPTDTITDKNIVPSIEKKVQEGNTYGTSNDATIGDTVYFQTTITTRVGARNYVVHDKMDDGLTFGSVTGITLNETNVDAGNYTVDTSPTDDCTFEVRFKQTFLDNLKTDDKIVISYTATLNEKADVTNGENNTTNLTFGDNNETEWDTTITRTYSFDLVKTKDDNTLLTGAKFKLYDAETNGNEIALVKESDDGVYRVALKEGETGVEIDAGKVTIKGLDSDTYWLEETQQPAGYNKLSGRIEVKIDKANLTATMSATDSNTWSNGGVHVINYTGSQLPGTGGMGTTIFYVLGGALMLGAVVLFITKKRMGQTEK